MKRCIYNKEHSNSNMTRLRKLVSWIRIALGNEEMGHTAQRQGYYIH